MKKILIIDDDIDMCLLLSRFLTNNGYEVEDANSGTKGIEKFTRHSFDIVICDYKLGDMNGKVVLEEIKKIDPEVTVLIITGYSDIHIAVQVTRLGAYDYIPKPLVPDEILASLNTISKELRLKSETPVAQKSGIPNTVSERMVSGSKTVKDWYRQAEIIAGTEYRVILYGENRIGKNQMAKMIHSMGRRKNKPFVAVDCSALSGELAESELFGHIKGAYTGAINDENGHLEMANGGTLFLDEVSELSPAVQAAFLRAIRERRFKKLGGTREIPLDIRLIAGSGKNLQEAYKKGKLRGDLYHCINEFSITIPTLNGVLKNTI